MEGRLIFRPENEVDMKPGERSELAEREQSERCQWSELGMESEGRNKGERRERMVKVEKWSDFDYALSGKALAKSHRRWWQGFSLPPILCGYIHIT